MKKLIYIVWMLCLGLSGCEKDPEYKYDNVDRIYFQYQIQNSTGHIVRVDSVVFSFGKLSDAVTVDTAKIVMQLMGNPSKEARIYRVKVLEEGTRLKGTTTMIEGKDYDPITGEQVFGPDRFFDTLRIPVYREYLSTSLRNPESKTLMLALEGNDDFQLGINAGYEMKLSVNNILFPPQWWYKYEKFLGFYHPKKWRKLIEMDPKFAVEDAFVGTDVDMQKKSGILNDWLKRNVIIDDETGMRITKDGLVEVEQ